MTACDTCGNDYAAAFTLSTSDGTSYTFDSFECAIEKTAPRCAHCGCRIIGHGVQAGDEVFCCAHCARHAGAEGAKDHTDPPG